jgi:hypothetical protein
MMSSVEGEKARDRAVSSVNKNCYREAKIDDTASKAMPWVVVKKRRNAIVMMMRKERSLSVLHSQRRKVVRAGRSSEARAWS